MNGKFPAIGVILLLLVLPHLSTVKGPVAGPVQLTFNGANDFNPVISSDSSKIAFSSDSDGDFEIFVMNSDGTGLLQLTVNNVNDTSPSISGNGSRIAYESDRGADADIWIINSDGTGRTALTSDSGDDLQPSISQDGLTVAFMSSGEPIRNQNPEGDFEIFTIKTDGTGLTQLTRNTATDGSPSINADGSRVAFASGNGPASEIWIANANGTGLTRLTNNAYADTSPSISADGGKIAFEFNGPASSSPLPLEVTYSFEVYVINSDGTGLTQVSGLAGDSVTPSISGDGTRVTHVSVPGDGSRQIIIVKSDGTGLTQITNNPAFNVEPATDYTGQTVVFMSNLDGDFEILSALVAIDVQDTAITQMDVPRTIGYNQITSNPLEVSVTLQNKGTAIETVTVEFSLVGGPVLASQTVTLGSGVSQNLTFWLNPQPLARGAYTPMARAVPLPGETSTGDNTLVGGPIQVRIPGDVDGDGDVDIIDAATLAYHYGTTCGSGSFYLVEADLDNDCDIDIIDAAALAFFYGTNAA